MYTETGFSTPRLTQGLQKESRLKFNYRNDGVFLTYKFEPTTSLLEARSITNTCIQPDYKKYSRKGSSFQKAFARLSHLYETRANMEVTRK